MKFGQLIKYNKRNIFLQKSCRKWGRDTSFRPFWYSRKLYMNVKASGLHRDMLKFDFLEKGLGIVSSPHFMDDFSRKMFSCNILLTDQFSLSDCLYFLTYWGNLFIPIVCFPCCDVINFEINLIFLIKPFFFRTKTWPKLQDKILNILRTKRAFKVR